MEDSSEGEVWLSDNSSEKDEVCVLSLNKHLVPKITGRKRNKCEAEWISEGKFAGMAKIVTFKGNHVKNTGIVRDSHVLLQVEEIGYLMQREALTVLNGNSSMAMMDVYSLIMSGNYGCTWEAFKVYLELKNLGYIISRHKVLWSDSSMKSRRPNDGLSNDGLSSLSGHLESLELRNETTHEGLQSEFSDSSINQDCRMLNHEITINDLKFDSLDNPNILASKNIINLNYGATNGLDFSMRVIKPMFDVFSPNSNFKKRNPGNPDFSLYISSDLPIDRVTIEDLNANNNGVPVTIATVDSGRVSFFNFNEVQLPILP
ncbi:hypothetical protein KP509_15G026400 [Ceratopteris richardii]|uniref:tRNA-splicing endonuclease subunit Sen54 N-terminal domain-containing protein n=2 Tax=Ceratopteris richardii TaxID=49495 RepID=A0A8T2T5I9_CERRI|nr:hypothetical protein KP509_15G026400 [Ceratopteris richardii]